MSSGNEPEKPEYDWWEYNDFDLQDYVFKNSDKADCSFVITDPTQKNESKRELRSFKWILSDMSPVLKEILDDEKNRAKNFKSIPISDKNFQSVLSYAHSKTLVNRSFGYILDLYESSTQYGSELLTKAIVDDMEKKDPAGNWIRFAAIAYRDFELTERLYSSFNEKFDANKELKKTFECELASNVETALNFDASLFRCLLLFMFNNKLSAILCFKTLEAYILKNIFKGKTPDKIEEEEDNLNIDNVNNFFVFIRFSEMSIEDFNNGPAKSPFLDEDSKKYLCTLVSKCIKK